MAYGLYMERRQFSNLILTLEFFSWNVDKNDKKNEVIERWKYRTTGVHFSDWKTRQTEKIKTEEINDKNEDNW